MSDAHSSRSSINVLVISNPGRERDSLQWVLASNDSIGKISLADNFSQAADFVGEKKTDLVIITLAIPADIILQQVHVFKTISPLSKYVVVSEKISYLELLQQNEVSGVLYQGFQSEDLFKIIDHMKPNP